MRGDPLSVMEEFPGVLDCWGVIPLRLAMSPVEKKSLRLGGFHFLEGDCALFCL